MSVIRKGIKEFPPFDENQVQEWKKTKKIGIIGLGDMGRLYVNKFQSAGWK